MKRESDPFIDGLLDELEDAGLIRRYQEGGQRFIQILNFSKYVEYIEVTADESQKH